MRGRERVQGTEAHECVRRVAKMMSRLGRVWSSWFLFRSDTLCEEEEEEGYADCGWRMRMLLPSCCCWLQRLDWRVELEAYENQFTDMYSAVGDTDTLLRCTVHNN